MVRTRTRFRRAAHLAGCMVAFSLLAPAIRAQAVAAGAGCATAAKDATNGSGPAGLVPYLRGPNLSLTTVGQHDSSEGWSSLLTPTAAYRFDRHWSAAFSVPVYARVNVVKTTSSNGKGGGVKTTETPEVEHGVLGDAALVGGFETATKPLNYQATLTLGVPTGDPNGGLGAGKTTFSFVNHVERAVTDWLTPELEAGFDTSASLNNTRVRKSYIVTGRSAHFQAGLGIDLPLGASFSTDAYEDLPVGSQTVTTTTTRGKRGKKATSTTQESAGEDNGFVNSLDIPAGRHVTVSAFYNRSLRNRIDTAGLSLTFMLRAKPAGL